MASVLFCACAIDERGSARPEPLQLLASGLFPASWTTPRTAFTVDLLKDFHLLSLQAQVNAHDFYRYLRRKTDNVGADDIPDRYRELLISMREFTFLRAARRAGVSPTRNLPPRSLAVLCPACPQPSMNMDPSWQMRAPEEEYIDALFHTVDGNFHQTQKNKPMDPNDRALSLGASYFANDLEFTRFQHNLAPTNKEASARLPEWLDFADHVSRSPLAINSPWMGLRRHVSGYDINCQYRLKFDARIAAIAKRAVDYPSILRYDFPMIVGAVGKFHSAAHRELCRFLFGYYWLPGVGMTDGEAPERIWATLNALASRTSQMTAGHRHDVINDHHSDMNARRVHGIAKQLLAKYTRAVKQGAVTQESLASLERGIENQPGGATKLIEWRAAEREWLAAVTDLKNHASLENPYQPRKAEALSQKQMLERLLAKQPSGVLGRGGLIGAIAEGIGLAEERAAILATLARDGASTSTVIEAKVDALRCRVEEWRAADDTEAQPGAVMNLSFPWDDCECFGQDYGHIDTPDDDMGSERTGASTSERTSRKPSEAVRETYTSAEDLDIPLPSTCDASIIGHAVMIDAVGMERQLWAGQANDALDELRAQLITSYAFKVDQASITGQIALTRANARTRHKWEAVEAAAASYRRARRALARLCGDQQNDLPRRLKKADVRPFLLYMENDGPGKNKQPPSWIWEDLSFTDSAGTKKDYFDDAVRAHWFRQHALNTRWDEELQLVKEEMRRTVRFFRFWQEHWEERAKDSAQGAGPRAYDRRARVRLPKRRDDALRRYAGAQSRELALGRRQLGAVPHPHDEVDYAANADRPSRGTASRQCPA
ncbi:hypothetical protein B0H21DRAFT_713026 [Amylocystis lapponica]|nr:hypothetical protein B0H21DRAFT_713026 [Amylocystis lapponica]